MTVATGPRPASRFASSTTPRASPSTRAVQLLHLGHEHDLLEQVVDARALQRGDLDHDGVAAPRLGNEPAFGELLEYPGRVGVVTVDLVDGRR